MDIHKPKPWHGVREFLKEYVIIVVGVLTALGAEQAVEWVHLRNETTEAREALRSEIERDLTIIRSNTQQDRCMRPYLRRTVAWTEGEGRPAAAPFFFNNLSSSAWETAKAGAVARMPIADRLAYADFYDRVETYNALVSREWDIAGRIGGRWRMGALKPEDAHALQFDVLEYDGLLRIKIAQEQAFEGLGARLGIKTPEINAYLRDYLAKVCALASAPAIAAGKPTDGF